MKDYCPFLIIQFVGITQRELEVLKEDYTQAELLVKNINKQNPKPVFDYRYETDKILSIEETCSNSPMDAKLAHLCCHIGSFSYCGNGQYSLIKTQNNITN